MRLLKAALGSMAGTLELYAAQVRTKVALIEAVALEEFEAELRAIDPTPEGRADIREAAIELAKAGITSEQIPLMARAYYRTPYEIKRVTAQLDRYADELTPGGNA